MRTFLLYIFGLLLAAASISCTDEPSPVSPARGTDSRAAAIDIAQLSVPPTLDAEFEALADTIPGFGGWFVDQEGTPTVYLVDPAQRERAQQLLASRIDQARRTHRPDGRGIGTVLQVRQGAYDFRQLRAWSRIAERLLDATSSAVYLDVDESSNRIEVGVSDAPTAAQISESLAGSGVPDAAMKVVVTGPDRTVTDITDRVRPVPAGVLITSARYCTLGFSANYWGTPGFVTASHCTLKFASLTSADNWANWLHPTGYLGREVADPSPWQSTTDCQSFLLFGGGVNGKCRYSDAAVIDYRYVTGDSVDFGYIVRTMNPGSGVGIVGSKTINPSNQHIELIGKYYSIPTGIYVDRVGQISGWMFHNISHSCQTRFLHPGSSDVDVEVKLWCQYATGGGANPGDSGGPFWAFVNCAAGQATRPDGTSCALLVGVAYGVSDDGRSLFSPISGVEMDLAGLGVLPSDKPIW
jgi:hypothetical protein